MIYGKKNVSIDKSDWYMADNVISLGHAKNLIEIFSSNASCLTLMLVI